MNLLMNVPMLLEQLLSSFKALIQYNDDTNVLDLSQGDLYWSHGTETFFCQETKSFIKHVSAQIYTDTGQFREFCSVARV
jgi:hypothetical protein